MRSLDKRFSLTEAEGRFQKACDQIVLLNHRLGEVQKRYKMAKRSNNKAFRYNLRLKLAVIEVCATCTTTSPTAKPTALLSFDVSFSTNPSKSSPDLTQNILLMTWSRHWI
ncbi:hypothetical protein MAR_017183 [Mya arenaria]|uniref:Uncharacterized protein n=1 Tax=Mya arenaria TaxID=6604 RepID=A0ABY7EDW1_MYAAR|nr:hypothetical protein MAR_017183 [Mya arenaria]